MEVVKVIGIEEVNRKLQALANRSKQKDAGSLVVGFSQNYAIYVHEVPARHKEGKQWKYLETVVRRLAPQIPRLVEATYLVTGSLYAGLLKAASRIQREAQEIVPIDTGALRASAFTAKDPGWQAVASAKQAQAESMRKTKLQKQKDKKNKGKVKL